MWCLFTCSRDSHTQKERGKIPPFRRQAEVHPQPKAMQCNINWKHKPHNLRSTFSKPATHQSQHRQALQSDRSVGVTGGKPATHQSQAPRQALQSVWIAGATGVSARTWLPTATTKTLKQCPLNRDVFAGTTSN